MGERKDEEEERKEKIAREEVQRGRGGSTSEGRE